MAVNFAEFMTRAGKMMKAAEVLDAARLTTVPDEVEDVTDEFNSATMEIRRTIADLPLATGSWQTAGNSLMSTLAAAFRKLLVQTVKDDNPQESGGIDDALAEFIKQMKDAGDNVDGNTLGATIADVGTPTGSGAFVLSTKRGDGLANQHLLAEDVSVEVVSDVIEGSESIRFRGEASAGASSVDWPAGSGASRTISAVDAGGSANLLSNGTFETEDSNATNLPADWIAPVGTLGTDLVMTPVEVQTVSIGGGPTGGYYLLHWTNSSGDAETTVPLAYNASSATVQTALRELDELSEVTVVESGTTPDLTHTITLTGVNNPAQLTSTDALTGNASVDEIQSIYLSGSPTGGTFTLTFDDTGSNPQTTGSIAYDATQATVETALEALSNITAGDLTLGGAAAVDVATQSSPMTISFGGASAATNFLQMTGDGSSLTGGTSPDVEIQTDTEGTGIRHDTTTAGDDDVLKSARALKITGDGSTVVTFQQRLTGLKDRTNYAVCLWMKVDATAGFPAAGALKIDLVDGIGGSVIADEQGASNTFTVDPKSGGDLSTSAFTAVTGVFRLPRVVNDVVYLRVRTTTPLTSAKIVYIDHVAIVEMTELYAGGPLVAAFSGKTPWASGDEYTLTVTNNRAGSIQEFFNRWLGMAKKRLLLPVSGGGTTYDDATYIV